MEEVPTEGTAGTEVPLAGMLARLAEETIGLLWVEETGATLELELENAGAEYEDETSVVAGEVPKLEVVSTKEEVKATGVLVVSAATVEDDTTLELVAL